MWGKNWEGQVVCCQCDNEAGVAVLNRRTSRDQDLMHLLQCLSFFEANFGFSVVAKHIPGTQNSLADDLSRDKLSSFLQARDQATLSLQSKPPEPLLNYRPDWTSPAWRGMFRDTFENGLVPSTRRTYQAGINKFVKFCGLYNISNPLPVSQSLLRSYISHLANSGVAYGTIKTYLAVIRYLQISQD